MKLPFVGRKREERRWLQLLSGWLTAIHQQNKCIKRKNRLIHRLRRQLHQANADHDHLKQLNAFLRERPDLPVDRIPAYKQLMSSYVAMQQAVASLEKEMDGQDATIGHYNVRMIDAERELALMKAVRPSQQEIDALREQASCPYTHVHRNTCSKCGWAKR